MKIPKVICYRVDMDNSIGLVNPNAHFHFHRHPMLMQRTCHVKILHFLKWFRPNTKSEKQTEWTQMELDQIVKSMEKWNVKCQMSYHLHRLNPHLIHHGTIAVAFRHADFASAVCIPRCASFYHQRYKFFLAWDDSDNLLIESIIEKKG